MDETNSRYTITMDNKPNGVTYIIAINHRDGVRNLVCKAYNLGGDFPVIRWMYDPPVETVRAVMASIDHAFGKPPYAPKLTPTTNTGEYWIMLHNKKDDPLPNAGYLGGKVFGLTGSNPDAPRLEIMYPMSIEQIGAMVDHIKRAKLVLEHHYKTGATDTQVLICDN